MPNIAWVVVDDQEIPECFHVDGRRSPAGRPWAKMGAYAATVKLTSLTSVRQYALI
jgi:hypothetical protein